jgi:hypothetical protein
MTTQEGKARIGFALSGGGHRATIFALGALLYLVDSGRQDTGVALEFVSVKFIDNHRDKSL